MMGTHGAQQRTLALGGFRDDIVGEVELDTYDPSPPNYEQLPRVLSSRR